MSHLFLESYTEDYFNPGDHAALRGKSQLEDPGWKWPQYSLGEGEGFEEAKPLPRTLSFPVGGILAGGMFLLLGEPGKGALG